MWLYNQISNKPRPLCFIATVTAVSPAIEAYGNGFHSNITAVDGLTLNIGDRIIILNCSGKTVALAKI